MDGDDGHKRITTGDNFTLVGGTQETHEHTTGVTMKFREKVKERGKTIEQLEPKEARDLLKEAGGSRLARPQGVRGAANLREAPGWRLHE